MRTQTELTTFGSAPLKHHQDKTMFYSCYKNKNRQIGESDKTVVGMHFVKWSQGLQKPKQKVTDK